MFDNDILTENAGETGLKCAFVMFAFLIFLAWPLLQISIGSQLTAMAGGLNAMAANSTQPHR